MNNHLEKKVKNICLRNKDSNILEKWIKVKRIGIKDYKIMIKLNKLYLILNQKIKNITIKLPNLIRKIMSLSLLLRRKLPLRTTNAKGNDISLFGY
jgi:hypothetical protein